MMITMGKIRPVIPWMSHYQVHIDESEANVKLHWFS